MSIHDDVRAVVRTRPDEVRAALAYLREWTGHPTTATDALRLAHRIGCGRAPSEAAARELAYLIGGWLAPHHQRQTGPILIGL